MIKDKISEKVAKCFRERVNTSSVNGNPARILNVCVMCEGGEHMDMFIGFSERHELSWVLL